MTEYEYVNVFHGNLKYDLPKPQGIASKWYFLKAGAGNTSPAATLPFGAMSAAPYSGGYPTGYGDNLKNTHSLPAKYEDGDMLLGFAHLQQSGTGTIGFYYNYALTTPFYKGENENERHSYNCEKASPGYYSCMFNDIKCELTASHFSALHRYTFNKNNPMVKIDFSNNGLKVPIEGNASVDEISIEKINPFTLTASIKAEGVFIHFAVKSNSKIQKITDTTVYFSADSKIAELSVTISLLSKTDALKKSEALLPFDLTLEKARDIWNRELSKIKIEADEKIKRIFYSNLYHSFVKPCRWGNEGFIYKNAPFVSDYATLWDMYKTALPMIMMLNKDFGKEIADSLIALSEALGYIPNSLGLSNNYMLHSQQVKAIGVYVLLTAYRFGIELNADKVINALKKDIFCEGNINLLEKGEYTSATWLLDIGDACLLAQEYAYAHGDKAFAEKLMPYTSIWKKAFDEDTGLLTKQSEYYEGSLYNYSFRHMADMEERIKLAGSKEKFALLLDDFFGYNKEDVVLPTNPLDPMTVYANYSLGRFEGFNNEPDMETPYTYVYADKHYRTCEIIRAGMKYMFSEGKGGLPGNNDSGALSSLYCFSALGFLPVAGQDLILFGSPVIDSAKITLNNLNTIEIKVYGNSETNIYVEKIVFNSNEVKNGRIKISDFMKGGKIEFFMSEKR